MIDSVVVKNAVRKVIAGIVGLIVAIILLCALLITSFYLLVQASIQALTPLVGNTPAMAIVGGSCALVLVLFFLALMAPMSSSKSSSKRKKTAGGRSALSVDGVRAIIREHPMESAMTAFAVGVVQQTDPKLRSVLLQGGFELMKHQDLGPGAGQGEPPV
ncbi:hypothetical protein LPB19_16660 [Marinobacter salinisoli]|uniref:Phage holin family protein n=1 Tax=Marinobacter salinisoli TaxID=2769486 RepID=A0ABX7MRF9_9GAMM|nr:hypothetical protein [Marinobacter salinisoli]QSP94778.1 hypothetical protein LPB19_16660 [Marinobacter salinisoli]